MEEDIKKLEKDITYNKRQIEEIGSYIPFDIKLMERVENLIRELKDSDDLLISMALELKQNKEYIRELEKENKELKEYIVVAPNLDEMTAVKYSHIQRDAYLKGRAEEQQKAEQIIYEHYIPKSKVKELIDECIPKGKNIMTGEEEYQPNTNANSFLTQSILELMEE